MKDMIAWIKERAMFLCLVVKFNKKRLKRRKDNKSSEISREAAMMDMIAWLMVLTRRGWVRVKFLFRDIAVRFERLAYLARMFNQLRKGEFSEDGFVKSIPCLDSGPSAVLRWVREVRDVTFYLGHRFDRKMAIYIVKECQELMRESYVYYAYMDGDELLRLKRGLYKLAGQLKSAMTPVSISDSVNFLLGRIYAVVRRTAFGDRAEDDDDGSEE